MEKVGEEEVMHAEKAERQVVQPQELDELVIEYCLEFYFIFFIKHYFYLMKRKVKFENFSIQNHKNHSKYHTKTND